MTTTPVSLGTRSNPGRYGAAGSARLINCFAEDAGGEGKTQWPLYAAAGLRDLVTLPNSGPIRAMETIGPLLYVVAGRSVFKVTENFVASVIGGIPTDGPLASARNMRENYPQIGLVSAGGAWIIENNIVTAITDPDLPPPVWIAQSDGYFGFPTTRSRWFVSSLQQGGSISDLEFATAESNPDDTVGIAENEREFVLFGQKSTEWWQNVGADPFPYTRSATKAIGCLSASSITRVDQTLGWVAHDSTVRLMTGYDGRRVSTHAVERSVDGEASKSTISGTSWTEQGHTFFALSGTDWTWVYDTVTGLWHERESYGLSRWKAGKVIEFAGIKVAGDAFMGKLYELSPDVFAEGSDPLVMKVQPPPVQAYPYKLRYSRLFLDMIPGVGLNSTLTADVDPQLMVEWSDDGGLTFGTQRMIAIGRQGAHATRAMLTRLGASSEDGRTFRFSISAAVVKGFTGAACDLTKLGF